MTQGEEELIASFIAGKVELRDNILYLLCEDYLKRAKKRRDVQAVLNNQAPVPTQAEIGNDAYVIGKVGKAVFNGYDLDVAYEKYIEGEGFRNIYVTDFIAYLKTLNKEYR